MSVYLLREPSHLLLLLNSQLLSDRGGNKSLKNSTDEGQPWAGEEEKEEKTLIQAWAQGEDKQRPGGHAQADEKAGPEVDTLVALQHGCQHEQGPGQAEDKSLKGDQLQYL